MMNNVAEFYAAPQMVSENAFNDAAKALREKGVQESEVSGFLIGDQTVEEKLSFVAGIKQGPAMDIFKVLPTDDMTALISAARAAGYDVEVSEL
ncbi:hypothetical protein D187_000650 [Cystobacter fuscus DSM 2262]|uniref:Uncharacterized protein n=1 Tax=Cystobacter fuscus (strain ATCC 25194 / DSM 2262 / NBRC 100088 / M29) TaxID=1242864 RepID=S9PLV7_CYSF2|nr:hypothetical protein [Cystobacter fuscus]EPX65225.1 hypothetical protein D187_000650 [Cystobacter fuscus DSM 2262]